MWRILGAGKKLEAAINAHLRPALTALFEEEQRSRGLCFFFVSRSSVTDASALRSLLHCDEEAWDIVFLRGRNEDLFLDELQAKFFDFMASTSETIQYEVPLEDVPIDAIVGSCLDILATVFQLSSNSRSSAIPVISHGQESVAMSLVSEMEALFFEPNSLARPQEAVSSKSNETPSSPDRLHSAFDGFCRELSLRGAEETVCWTTVLKVICDAFKTSAILPNIVLEDLVAVGKKVLTTAADGDLEDVIDMLLPSIMTLFEQLSIGSDANSVEILSHAVDLFFSTIERSQYARRLLSRRENLDVLCERAMRGFMIGTKISSGSPALSTKILKLLTMVIHEKKAKELVRSSILPDVILHYIFERTSDQEGAQQHKIDVFLSAVSFWKCSGTSFHFSNEVEVQSFLSNIVKLIRTDTQWPRILLTFVDLMKGDMRKTVVQRLLHEVHDFYATVSDGMVVAEHGEGALSAADCIVQLIEEQTEFIDRKQTTLYCQEILRMAEQIQVIGKECGSDSFQLRARCLRILSVIHSGRSISSLVDESNPSELPVGVSDKALDKLPTPDRQHELVDEYSGRAAEMDSVQDCTADGVDPDLLSPLAR